VGRFTLLEHTADVGVSACGESLEEALRWLAAGTFSLIVDPDTVADSQSRVVSVSARDRESLAVDWLNELLYQYEATGFLLKDCRIFLEQCDGEQCDGEQRHGEHEELKLEAHCRGDLLDPARHHILTVVKAATYHDLSVSQGRGWQINVILDV